MDEEEEWVCFFKDPLRINSVLTGGFQSFKVMAIRSRSLKCIRFLIIYRPPKSSYSSFFQDFSRLLEQVLTDAISHIIISGDFSLHVENLKYHHAWQFIDILDPFGLKQNVMEDTCIHGHTLDLLITK